MTQDGASGESSGPGSAPGAGASPDASSPVLPAAGAPFPEAAGASAPRERGWWRLVVAVLAFLLVPASPMRAAVPVEQTFVLLVVAFAACALVGWWAGGRLGLALVWAALAVLVLTAPAVTSFDRVSRGWALLLGASFGLVCVFGRQRAFFGRALSALGVALVVGLLAMATSGTSPLELRAMVEGELSRRSAEYLATVRDGASSPDWQRFVQTNPGAASLVADGEPQMRALVTGGTLVFPAMLALESLVALALAWSLYHRVSRARLGPPLARVKDFRFNDQLVWGLIVGLVVVLLPSLAGLRPVGTSLLVFFGALYALRGFGVLAWFVSPQRAWLVPVIGVALVTLPFATAVALGLGLGDTWLDWRTRGQPRATT